MSRIGKKPVDLPSGVTASVSGQTVEVDLQMELSCERGQLFRLGIVLFKLAERCAQIAPPAVP